MCEISLDNVLVYGRLRLSLAVSRFPLRRSRSSILPES